MSESKMNLLGKSTVWLFLGCSAVLAHGAHDRMRDWGDLRNVIDRTQADLQSASGLEHGDKQRARYQHAQDDLSKLDRKLVKGKFDKEAFEHSLGAIKSILDHNTLQARGRDALMQDLSDLKVARDRRY